MNIKGIDIENIEKFNNNRALVNLNISLLLANHKKYRVEYYSDKIEFIDIHSKEIVYTVNLCELSSNEKEAINVAFNKELKESKYDIKFTCKNGEYVYVLIPTMIPKEDKQGRFTFKALDIIYAKVERIYGANYTYTLCDIIEAKETIKRHIGIPNIFCFKNIYDAITACKVTPESGYENLEEFEENCEKYIKYHYCADTGYAYKSVIPYDFLVDYDITGSTLTYELEYDTNEECAYTYTLPIMFNEATGKIIKNIKKCRADSLGSDGINISLNNEQISIKRVRVKVAFSIDEIKNK